MKTKRMFVGTLGVLFMLSLMGGTAFSPGVNQQTAEMLYEEAMLKKDGDGNLPAAIKLFQQILAEFSQNRRIAGQAQLQIGLCYEKLGESEALKAYKKVIEEYADQPAVLRTARERITFLESERSPQRIEDEFSMRKISIPYGEPSPDGKWVAYQDDYLGLSFSLSEMSTGNIRVLVELEKDQPLCFCPYFPGGWWSPSGNQIAYLLCHSPVAFQDLRLIDRTGSDNRILFSNPERSVQGIAGWTPDEKYIVVSLWNEDRTVSFVKISTSDGQVEELITAENLGSYSLCLSPDGQYLAYNFVKEKYSGNSDIGIYSFEGAFQDDIIDHPADDNLIGWTPSGNHLLFESDRAGDTGIWAQSIKNGKPIGEAKLIKAFSGSLMPMGFTNDGGFYFEEYQGGTDVYEAQIDLETGKTLQEPEKIEKKYSGITTTSFWSNDGKYFGYFVMSKSNIFATYANKLRIHSMKDGSKRDILFDFDVSTFSPPKWSKDGKFLFMRGRKDKKFNFFKLDVDSGKTEILLDNKSLEDWSSDGRILYKVESNRGLDISKRQNWLLLIETKTGTETELFRTSPGQRMGMIKLSHDEKWIAFKLFDYNEQFTTRYAKICVVPTGGGEVRELYQKKISGPGNLWWGPQDKGLLFSVAPDQDKAVVSQECELWYIPSLEAQSARKLDLKIFALRRLSFNPDGKTITFTASEPTVSNIWIMENYLPKEKK